MLSSFPRRDSPWLDVTESKKARYATSSFISLCALAITIASISTGPSRLRQRNFSASERLAFVGDDFQPFEKLHYDESDGQLMRQDDLDQLYKRVMEIQTENERLQLELHKKQARIDFLKKKLSVPATATGQSSTERILLSELAKSSHRVKGEVIDLIINGYISPDSPDDKDKTLGSALEAIKLKQTDGDPVQVRGYPFLLVGSVGASLNKKSFLEHKITHVVNWSNSARCDVFDGVQYLCVDGIRGRDDMSRPESVEKLRYAVEFVERARLAGGKVMSHCWYGRNRSVTLLVAYLMKYAGMGIHEATHLIAETRPEADPYVEALELYRKKYLAENTPKA